MGLEIYLTSNRRAPGRAVAHRRPALSSVLGVSLAEGLTAISCAIPHQPYLSIITASRACARLDTE